MTVSSPEAIRELDIYLKKYDNLIETSIEKAKEKSDQGSFRDHIYAIKTLNESKTLVKNAGLGIEDEFTNEEADVILERIQRITFKNK